jgi:hypothetical protein
MAGKKPKKKAPIIASARKLSHKTKKVTPKPADLEIAEPSTPRLRPAVFDDDEDHDLSVDEEEEQALIRQEEEEEVGGDQDEDQDRDDTLEPDLEGNIDSEGSDDSLPARVMIRIIPKKRNKQPNSMKPKSMLCLLHVCVCSLLTYQQKRNL